MSGISVETGSSGLWGKLRLAAIGLASVLSGYAIYYCASDSRYYLTPTGAAMIGGCAMAVAGLFFLRRLGRTLMSERPREARWLIETWACLGIPLGALSTALLITALIWIGDHLATPATLGKEQGKQLFDLIDGAITAFFATVLTSDLTSGAGAFSVSDTFKSALETSFERMRPQPERGTPAFQAVFRPSIDGRGEVGWDFAGRGARAEVLARFVQASRAAKPVPGVPPAVAPAPSAAPPSSKPP
jgi:hypothetical protein